MKQGIHFLVGLKLFFGLLIASGCGQAPAQGEACAIPNSAIQWSTQRCGLVIQKTPSGFVSDSFNNSAACPNTNTMADGTYSTFSSAGCYFDVKNGGTELSPDRLTKTP